MFLYFRKSICFYLPVYYTYSVRSELKGSTLSHRSVCVLPRHVLFGIQELIIAEPPRHTTPRLFVQTIGLAQTPRCQVTGNRFILAGSHIAIYLYIYYTTYITHRVAYDLELSIIMFVSIVNDDGNLTRWCGVPFEYVDNWGMFFWIR